MRTWKCVRRGFHTDGRLYVSRTRYGWEYGYLKAGDLWRVDETTRPIERAKELAERIDVETDWSERA